MSEDTYEIYAVRYAHHDRRSSENFIAGDPHEGPQPLDYYVWAIVGGAGNWIFDTGFDAAMAERRKRTLTNPVGDGLQAIGIDPGQVENVIISHLHYDHAGNHDLFPRAHYHLQDLEIGFATGRSMCHGQMRLPFHVGDIVAMVRQLFAGHVVFHDGAEELAPGLSVHHIGGHTMGLQSVRVKTRRGHVVLASDAAHLYDHFERGLVYPIVYNVAAALEGYETLKGLATSPDHIIPGHDPLVLERYPAARPDLADWVVRLDAEPERT